MQLNKRGRKVKTYKMYLMYRVKGKECFPCVITVEEPLNYLNEVVELKVSKI